jgi:hypothetical protein
VQGVALWLVAVYADGTPPAEGQGGPQGAVDSSASGPSVKVKRLLPTDDQLVRVLEEKAEDNVRAGRVPPVLHAIQRTAQETFQPDWAQFQEHRGPRAAVAAAGRSMLHSYMTGAQRYAGNEPGLPPARPAATAPLEGQRGTAGEAAGLNLMFEKWDLRSRQWIADSPKFVTEVCLDLGPGCEPTAAITRRSGRATLDEQALRSALDAARAARVPDDAGPLRACYRFTTHFAVSLPVQATEGTGEGRVVSYSACEFPKSTHDNGPCTYPMKRVVTRDVELIFAGKP